MFRNRLHPMLGLAATLLPAFLLVITVLVISPSPSVAYAPLAVSVGLVPTESGISDLSFNQLAYEGLVRAENELGVVGAVYTTTGPADYEPMLQQCVDDGNNLCISVVFFMEEATRNVAASNPGTLFAIVDTLVLTPSANLRSLLFAVPEASYLAGTLAGLLTESDVVGGVGGIPFPSVEAFLDPYRIGAQCANPQATVLLTYTGTFVDPDLGAEVAQQMLGQGADVILAAAGLTGVGAVLTTTQSGALGIGVDVDEYYTTLGGGGVDGADRLLTSVLKGVDNAVYHTIADVVAGTFTSGTLELGLVDNGVGLAPYHEAEVFVPQSVRDTLDLVRSEIIAGTIDPYDPWCGVKRVFLPIVVARFAP